MASQIQADPNRDFINAFDVSLRRLNDINAAIAKNTENKRNFTGFVLTKLQELHEKIKAIVDKIKEIKQKIIALHGQVNVNNTGVQSKDAELANLKQQLDQLTNERNNLTAQLDQVRNDANANATRLQEQINANEVQLRDCMTKSATLETEKAELERQLNAIRADMANRGDAQMQAHADQLKQLTEQHTAEIERLQRQIADNERQIQELTNQHGAKDAQTQDLENRNRDLETRVNALQEQLNAAQTELQTLQQNYNNLDADSKARIEQALQDYRRLQEQIEENNRQITTLQAAIDAKDQEILRLQNDANNVANTIRDKDSEIANLNNQIAEIAKQRDELKAFSNELEGKIKAATDAITNVTNNLAELTNQGFYEDSNNRVQSIIAEIEKTLGIINGEIEDSLNQRGQLPAGGVTVPNGPPGGLSPQSPRESSSKFNISQVNIRGYNYSSLMQALKARSAKESDLRGNRFNKAILEIEQFMLTLNKTTATNNSVKTAIEKILNSQGVRFSNNGAVMGGYNKTNKKHKKPKKTFKFTRKQRGGFLYGKYKKTATSTTSAKSTTKTTYDHSTRKKNRRNRGMGITKKHK
jgi:chromosome segregation ATPase